MNNEKTQAIAGSVPPAGWEDGMKVQLPVSAKQLATLCGIAELEYPGARIKQDGDCLVVLTHNAGGQVHEA